MCLLNLRMVQLGGEPGNLLQSFFELGTRRTHRLFQLGSHLPYALGGGNELAVVVIDQCLALSLQAANLLNDFILRMQQVFDGGCLELAPQVLVRVERGLVELCGRDGGGCFLATSPFETVELAKG